MKRTFAVTALSIACTWTNAAGADTVEDVLLPLLGLHGNRATALTNPWLQAPEAGVVVSLHNEDLLRRYVDSVRVAYLSARQIRVAAMTATVLPAARTGIGRAPWAAQVLSAPSPIGGIAAITGWQREYAGPGNGGMLSPLLCSPSTDPPATVV